MYTIADCIWDFTVVILIHRNCVQIVQLHNTHVQYLHDPLSKFWILIYLTFNNYLNNHRICMFTFYFAFLTVRAIFPSDMRYWFLKMLCTSNFKYFIKCLQLCIIQLKRNSILSEVDCRIGSQKIGERNKILIY